MILQPTKPPGQRWVAAQQPLAVVLESAHPCQVCQSDWRGAAGGRLCRTAHPAYMEARGCAPTQFGTLSPYGTVRSGPPQWPGFTTTTEDVPTFAALIVQQHRNALAQRGPSHPSSGARSWGEPASRVRGSPAPGGSRSCATSPGFAGCLISQSRRCGTTRQPCAARGADRLGFEACPTAGSTRSPARGA
jgi:hypothetical protein